MTSLEQGDVIIGESEELDLTNAHLHDEDLQEVTLPEGLKALDLTANRLKAIDSRILALGGLSSLSFRQNLLQDAAALAQLRSASVLRHLILHDNQLAELEVSYNAIRSMEGLRDLPGSKLQQFYAACNKIQEIQGLGKLTALRTLELGGNRIRDMHSLADLELLEELWLGRNRIEKITGLGRLVNLKQLSLQNNRLTSLAGLEECSSLQELYVSHNGIESLQGVESLTNLVVLDASNNKLSRADGLRSLKSLEDLWLNDNQLQESSQVQQDLSGQRQSLTCIYLSNNPVVHELGSRLEQWARQVLPQLKQLDADLLQ